MKNADGLMVVTNHQDKLSARGSAKLIRKVATDLTYHANIACYSA